MKVHFFNTPYVVYEGEIHNINMKATQHRIGFVWLHYNSVVILDI